MMTTQIDQDGSLVAALRRGDPTAAEDLVAVYGDRACRLATRITRNAPDAEEAVQDAFLSVTRKVHTFRGDATFSSWIYRIVANAAYQCCRRRRRRAVDVSLDNLLPAMTFFQAAPYFFIAIVLVAVFATRLGWFPAINAYDQTLVTPGWNWGYLSNVLDHAFLPALTIVLASVAGWIVGMRNVMVTTMDEDYVLVAQAKGLPKRRVVSYAARNAILPSVTGFSLAIGFVVSGALLTEIVFSYPGIGYILQQAVLERDYPLLQGVFLIITFTVLTANLIADFAYVLLDPRTRQEA